MDYSLSELSEVFSCDPVRGELYWLPRDRKYFNNDFSHRMWNLNHGRDKYLDVEYIDPWLRVK